MTEQKRIRAVVVDDEPLGRDRVRMLAERHDELQVIAECADGRSAVDAIQDKRPDLVFLDVQMPELDGFGVIEEIGVDRMPAVIFVTAYDRHALRAFEVHALDYLLKPFRADRFFEAVERVVRIVREGRRDAANALGDLMAERAGSLDRILVKGSKKDHFVRVSQIDWVEAAGNYIRLHTGAREHLIRQTMRNLEGRLDPGKFVRIHRSAIVNVDNVKELRRNGSGEYEVILLGGKRLKVSRGYRRNLDRFDPLAPNFAL